MKILLGYSYYPYLVDIRQWNEDWIARLRVAGIEAHGTCLTLNPPGGRLSWADLDRRWKNRDRELLTFYERLALQAQDFDVFVNYNGLNLHPEFVPQLPTFNVYCCFDDPESSNDLSRPVAAAYDLCMVGNIAELDAYRSWGVKEARFLPNGFRPDDYSPTLTKQQILEGHREVASALLCERTSPWRSERLDRFVAAFPDGAYYGHGWPKGFLPESQRVPLLQRTKIGLNLHNSTGPINFRTYYLPANGVCQICDNKSHLGQIYELNREAVGFDTIEEAIDLVHYYLAHDEERRQIAAAGWERACRDYNEVASFQHLIRAVNEVMAKRDSTPQVAEPIWPPAETTSLAMKKGASLDTRLDVFKKPLALATGKIILHTDTLYAPDQWYRRFSYLLHEHYHLSYTLVDLLATDRLRILADGREGEALIGRFGHNPKDLQLIRPVFEQLWRAFQGRVFPTREQYFYYDDKVRQMDLFRKRNYAFPHTAWVRTGDELTSFLSEHDVRFPLVVKNAEGAGSSNVRLAHHFADVTFPCLVQDFCAGNDRDWRINVIGNRVMGFERLVRANDFRASGSGKIVYPDELPPEAVRLAYRISQENHFPSMAYDFVKRGDQWVVLEMSYVYTDTAVRDCKYYYDMTTGAKMDKQGKYPQDFILADFLKEHYGIEKETGSAKRIGSKRTVSCPQNNAGTTRSPVTSTASPRLTSGLELGRKPRILIIADDPNWIFERHAHVLHRFLGEEFDFTLGFQREQFQEADFDLIYALEWNLATPDQIRTPEKWITGIRSHLSWDREPFPQVIKRLCNSFQRVHVVSQRLLKIFAPQVPGIFCLSHGVDTEHFTPRARADQSGRKLRLGWAGNRLSGSKKGFKEIIEPLGKLPGVELVFCGYHDRNLSLEEMRDFYDSLDAYVCASDFEGNNNSLMEAAAMQRALITTDNGTVPEYLEHETSALIVPRELPAFVQAVLRLRDDPALRMALGERARLAVQSHFEWRDLAEQHRTFFKEALDRRNSQHGSAHGTQSWITSQASSPAAKIELACAEPAQKNSCSLHELHLLATACMQQQHWAQGLQICAKILKATPDDVNVLLFTAKCLFETGDRKNTALISRRVLELDPKNEVALENLVILGLPAGVPIKPAVEPPSARPVLSSVDQEKFDRISCPFCGSEKAETFRHSADIVQCARCATVYLRTRYKTEILEEIYQTYADEGSHMRLPKSLDEAARSCLKRDYFLQEILQFVKPEGKFLDIGCGWGAFLLNARDHGFEPTGMELTRKAVAYANEQLRIPVVNTQFLDTPYQPASFQVVTMNHVLEHLPFPKAVLAKVFRLLKPDGVFCGIVPNIGSFCAKTLGEQWFWLDPNYHYVHYTPSTLRKHLEDAGFRVERLYTATGDYGPAAIREAALKLYPALKDDQAFAVWLKKVEADNEGEELRFIARKPAAVNVGSSPTVEQIPVPIASPVPGDECLVGPRDHEINACLKAAAQALELLDWCQAREFLRQAAKSADKGSILNGALCDAIAQLDHLVRCAAVAPAVETADSTAEPAGFSFCIITNGKRPERLHREIESIRRLGIPNYEILVGGEPPEGLPGVTVVRLPEAARCGRLGEMRNRLVERARFNHLIVADDDLVFLPDFYQGLMRYGDNYQVQCVRFLNPDGSRYWDWATNAGPRGHALLPYEETDPHVYVTGGICIMKAEVARRVKWDEGRGFYQGEDADFSRRLGQAGISIKFNPYCTIVHHDRRYTQFGNIILTAESLRQTARDRLIQHSPREAEQAFQRLRLLAPDTVATFAQFQVDTLAAKRDGRFYYLADNLWPADTSNTNGLTKAAQMLAGLLDQIGPFYLHVGGAGDALLLLSTFLDQNPSAQVVSLPNSIPAARSFFEAFPTLKRIWFLPKHNSPQIHLLVRIMMRLVPNCQGMGVTPEIDYLKEWHAKLDIFKHYRVSSRPRWALSFRTDPKPKQVVLAPKGSLQGMVGSKRNIIDPAVWPELLRYLQQSGFQPVVIGTPDESQDYPGSDGCADRRSYSFREQIDCIANSAALIGADSWAKTYAALAGIPTIVFEPLKGADWIGKKDASDFVFLDPWEAITVVKDLAQCRKVFANKMGLPAPSPGPGPLTPLRKTDGDCLRIAWEGTFLDYGSLSHVNREVTSKLARQPNLGLTRIGSTLLANGYAAVPELQRLARSLIPQPPHDVQVTIRHAWPPNWSPVKRGALVVIQPWEFGSLPVDWVAQALHVNQFWVPSEHVRQVYVRSGIPSAKVKVVPNGIDPEKFHPEAPPLPLSTAKSFKFLFVGGTIHRKGPDVLLQAYLNAFTNQDDVCLVIKDFGGQSCYAGQTFETAIQAAQRQPNAPEILYLTDELAPECLPGLYTACNCLVHPYRGEGFGLPVLEAMACGLPVIVTEGGATDDFATPELVYRVPAQIRTIGRLVGKINLVGEGWLLEPSVSVTAARMRYVFEHADEARAKGQAASKRVRQDWTWEQAAHTLREHLNALTANPERSPTRANIGPARTPVSITLPPCALIGHIGPARELLRQKKHAAAWQAALAAIQARPFNPEAYLLLAVIAQTAGDSVSARRCAQHARVLAPGWLPAKKFLKGKLRGNAKHEWLVLPAAINAGEQKSENGEQKSEVRSQKSEDGNQQAKQREPLAAMSSRLTVCMIVKNEEKFLPQCLRSIKELASQIVVVDTGSTDKTVAIAGEFGAEVYHFAWCDDFSAARNAALEHAAGDWILMLDADEELPRESHVSLRKAMQAASVMAWRLPIVDVGREEDGCSYVPRLFRNAPALFYVSRVHEQVFSSIEARREEWGLENHLGDAVLRHYGYTAEMTKDRGKVERNLRLLEKAVAEIPEEPSLLMHYGLELVRSGDLAAGLEQYQKAFELMSTLPPSIVAPEARETLLTQFCSHLMAAKKPGEVVRVLTSSLACNGGLTASHHYALGLAYLELKQWAPAAEQMRHCLVKRHRPALSPIIKEIRQAGPNHVLGVCLINLKQFAEAESAFQAALHDDPAAWVVRFDYARLQADQGRMVEALQMLHSLALEKPEAIPVWQVGAQIALSRPAYLEFALDWTAVALEKNPHASVLLQQRAETLLLNQEPAQALSLWRQLPNSGSAVQMAALVLCELLAEGRLSQLSSALASASETQVSQEFIMWYRRLLSYGAKRTLDQVNAQLHNLHPVLPSATATLRKVIAEAATI